MTNQNIEDLLRLRWAVYKLGSEDGAWNALEEESVTGFMNFLFPKSEHLAYYNLMINVVNNSDTMKENPIGSYSLFKFPEQLEEKILNYQKNSPDKIFSDAQNNPMEILDGLATIVSEGTLYSSSVGTLDSIGVDDMIRILAYRYRDAFRAHFNNYPYFE